MAGSGRGKENVGRWLFGNGAGVVCRVLCWLGANNGAMTFTVGRVELIGTLLDEQSWCLLIIYRTHYDGVSIPCFKRWIENTKKRTDLAKV
jgi:hypothetical protein